MRQHQVPTIALGLGLLLLGGCGSNDGLERVLVSGTVTYQGAPVEIGQIRFIPEQGTRGPVTIEKIEKGAYTTRDVGGVPVGAHRIEIRGFDSEEYAKGPSGPGAPGIKQLLPQKYNDKSTLVLQLTADSPSREENYDLEP